jgi:hypothetical protein
MTRVRIVAVPLFSIALAATPALAHHGWSGYDNSREMTISGVITTLGYEHPHGHIRVDFRGRIWTATLAAPWRMERRGLHASMMAPGTKVTVVGYPSRTDPSELRAERIIIDGKTFDMR